MTHADKIQQFIKDIEEALAPVKAFQSENPGDVFDSIIAQLEYLLACLAEGKNPRAEGKNFIFGYLGVREVRDFDPELGRTLVNLNDRLDKLFPPRR